MRFGGRWTETKLEILEAYLNAYTTALKHKPFKLIYIDAFAGTDRSSGRRTGRRLASSTVPPNGRSESGTGRSTS